MAVDSDNISFSLQKLQRLRATFDELHNGRPIREQTEAQAFRLVQQLSTTALRSLLTEFASAVDSRAVWAHALLASLASTQRKSEFARRLIASCKELHSLPCTADRTKVRAMALLAELGVLPESPELLDPEALRQQSLRDLAGCLDTAAEVAQAAELLLAQLDFEELFEFLDDLSTAEPPSAAALVDELLIRDDVDEHLIFDLRRIRASLVCAGVKPSGDRAIRRVVRSAGYRVGTHRDGRRVIVISRRQSGSRPSRWRALCVLLDDGAIIDTHYRDDLTVAKLEGEIFDLLRGQGFELAAISLPTAKAAVTAAAQRTIERGLQIPRAYYLGRDLLGIRDEHLTVGRRLDRGDHELPATLARAIDLLSMTECERALPLLERYVAEIADDPDGHANLGLCLLELGEHDDARAHLDTAARLEPDNPLHLWNIAALAHRENRLGGCYLALSVYAQLVDNAADASVRRETARSFAAEYERHATLDYPNQHPISIAIADEKLRGFGDLDTVLGSLASAGTSVENSPF